MILAADLLEMLSEGIPAVELREKLSMGLRQETEEERQDIRCCLSIGLGNGLEVFKAVLDAASNEVIVPTDRGALSMLAHVLGLRSVDAAMAVVERMRKDGLRTTHGKPVVALSNYDFDKEVEEAVISVIDPSVFDVMTSNDDILRHAICFNDKKRVRALKLVLKYGPTMEERLEAGMEPFRYVHAAASRGDLKTLQQMHDLLPLLPDESGRRGELADYARAIELAAANVAHVVARDAELLCMMEYLAEQAGNEEVFDLCSGITLLTPRSRYTIEWLMARAPQLVEAACHHPKCLSLLVIRTRRADFMVNEIMRNMVELVEPQVLCGLMRQAPPFTMDLMVAGIKGWRLRLKPLHDAVPGCMDGLRWKWLVRAIEDRDYDDVEYMLGMCTREHLIMRNAKGDRAYDMAARDLSFPKELLEGLGVVHMAKRAYG